jgi:trehalose 6-phosphate synthase/phosphatase
MRKRDPDLKPDETDFPEGDFLEGGEELTPPLYGDDVIVGDEVWKLPTRSLTNLEDCQLDEFWPRGHSLKKALFLDYDGTLREFENKPEMAVPTEEIKKLLAAINDRPDFAPHIISGRNASFLEEHFASLSSFTLVAEHGFQIWRSGTETWTLFDGTTDHEVWKSIIRKEMFDFVNGTPGSHLEEKASSLVWHYREASNQESAEKKALDVVDRLQCLVDNGGDMGNQVRISLGHKIVEASYQKVRKGPVMRKLCEEKALFGDPYAGVLIAGDDVSDESMFDAAPKDYLTIKVGAAETSARYRVDSPQAFRTFLIQLLTR